MQLRYAFRLYPEPGQRAALARAFGCARVVFNDALRAREDARTAGLPFPSAAELSKRLITQARHTVERCWLGEVSSVVLQQALRDVDAAYRNFFTSLKGERGGKRVGAPRFKSRKDTRQSIRFTANARWKITGTGWLSLPKIGDVRVKWSRVLPAVPSSVTVILDSAGRYFASFVIDTDSETDRARWNEPEPGSAVGIDLGLTLPQRGYPHRGPLRWDEDLFPAVSASCGEEAEEGAAGAVPQTEGIEKPGQGPREGRPCSRGRG
jgi:putative transposase